MTPAAETGPARLYLSAALLDSYAEPILRAAPGAQVIVLDAEGCPTSPISAQQPEANAEPEYAALLVSYDLFIAHMANPAIADNLCKLARRCAWVQAGSAGADDPLLQQVRAASHRYCNGAGVHAVPISQYVFAQLLRWYRRIDLHAEQQREHRWQPFMADCELTGKTLGILGYGGIGAQVGRLGQAFGMKVLGWRRNAQPDSHADEVLAGDAGLQRVLSESDCLVLCLPLSEQTRGLMNAERLRSLKPGAVLVNVGRGNTLDEAALLEMLNSGHIAFAALDTTTEEPLGAQSPLWDAPNCHITPHDSAWSPLALPRLCDLFCDNLQHWLAGRPLRNEEVL